METVNLKSVRINAGVPVVINGGIATGMRMISRFNDFLEGPEGEALYYKGVLVSAHIGIHDVITREIANGALCFTSGDIGLFLKSIRFNRKALQEFEGASLYLPYGNGESCRRAYYSKKDGWVNGDPEDARVLLIIFKWV